MIVTETVNGKRRRQSKPRKTTPFKDAIVNLHNSGKTSTKIADELGIDSDRDVRREIERAEIRFEVLDELGVDPNTLVPSAQAKLEIAKRMLERKLNAEYTTRMRGLDEEVRQRVLKEGVEYVERMKALEAEAWNNEKHWRDMVQNHKPPFTLDQFKAILMCLHPDGERTEDRLSNAFQLFNDKKLQLTGKK